jgi:adenylosuccinate lyase
MNKHFDNSHCSTSTLAVGAYDGRYYDKSRELVSLTSQYALIRNRILVSAMHFKKIITSLGHEDKVRLDVWEQQIINPLFGNLVCNTVSDKIYDMVQRCEEIDRETNHDVMAVVRFLKELYTKLDIGPPIFNGYIHLGLTSQDINTSSIMLMIYQFDTIIIENHIHNILKTLDLLKTKATSQNDYMLSMTHGQPATPTRMSWVLNVFINRLMHVKQINSSIAITTKFGGATGGMNAFNCLNTDIDWHDYADKLCEKMLLKRTKYTTQVDSYDDLTIKLNMVMSMNQILYDLCQDVWHYISRNIFNLKTVQGEDGSSAMPNKVNPIHFENAMGNISIANGLIQTLATTLPVSIMQRDLRDSTILRQLGNIFSACLVAWKSIQNGLNRLEINFVNMKTEIDDNIVVVVEGIQTVLRLCGQSDAYDTLKKHTRGKHVTKDLLIKLIIDIELDDESVKIAYNGTKTIADVKQNLYNIVNEPSKYFDIIS